MNLDLQILCRYWTEEEGRASRFRSRFVGDARPTGMCWVSLDLFYKRVLLKRIASIVFDRNSLLPFNPTYVLSNVNTPYSIDQSAPRVSRCHAAEADLNKIRYPNSIAG